MSVNSGAITISENETMKFMLMMNTPAGSGAVDYNVASWGPDDFKAHIAFMMQLNADLRAAGELVSAEGLAAPSQAKLVRAGKSASQPATDGVFPETKEFLAGFWIVDVDSSARAYEIAGHVSAAPGPGGKPINMAVEVREVMSAPPVDA